jgi:ParB-like nuclease domain
MRWWSRSGAEREQGACRSTPSGDTGIRQRPQRRYTAKRLAGGPSSDKRRQQNGDHMSFLRRGVHNAKVLKDAVTTAEQQLERPPDGKAKTIKLRPAEITTRPELFQPREFSMGLREVDPRHVKKLRKAARIKGELKDPIVVVKLGGVWTCVDGHHRLEAYRKEKRTEPIKCEWFGGTLREAVDESVARNEVYKLPMGHADRFEAAWKRVLLDWGSKADIVALCGVGEGTVAMMRRVKRRYSEANKWAEEFRARLGRPLMECSWSTARMAYLMSEPVDTSKEKRAAKLARQLVNRMTDTLSRDPVVTAKALELYDPELVEPLAEALNAVLQGRTSDEQAVVDAGERTSDAKTMLVAVQEELAKREEMPDALLRKRLADIEKLRAEIVAEIERRETVGTRSDLVWQQAVLEAQARGISEQTD